MASIKKINDRKFKITISNGYRPDGKKIAKAKMIEVPKTVQARSIMQPLCVLFRHLSKLATRVQTILLRAYESI